MANPSTKSADITNFLEGLSGRSTAIENDICVKPPFGCGKPATEFTDELSKREFTISGLCQMCQNKIFGS
tara:strand:+ start:2223 stop:2432 length:210 start_codon:yes stop_codon:yes gene_type:complete